MSTAVVTGASHGFGLGVATSLAAAGWDLVIDARSESPLLLAGETVALAGPGVVMPVVGDVTDPIHIENLVGSAEDIGEYRLLVNNASVLGPTPLPRMASYPIEDLKKVLAVNVLGPLSIIQASLPQLRRNRGAVVNVTSDAAVEPYEGWGGYGLSKAALEQMSNVLAKEEPEVRVYWFDPGDMRTRMHQDAFPGEDISDRPLPETRVPGLIGLLRRNLPSGRFTAEELLAEMAGP